MRNILIVEACDALRNIQPMLGTRQGNVEFAGILCQLARVVATVIVGHTSVDGIEYDDIVKLQSLCLVYV